jgi:hypothetical protein
MLFQNLAIPLLALPRWTKRFVVLTLDTSLCVLTVWLAYYLRLGEFVALSGVASSAVLMSVGIALPIFVVSGLSQSGLILKSSNGSNIWRPRQGE